ncbi:MAG: inorganic phosphate transporter [Acidobacteria bacterium]|nr:inorganic phosphate transporter [Acidobacteriota bacterium]
MFRKRFWDQNLFLKIYRRRVTDQGRRASLPGLASWTSRTDAPRLRGRHHAPAFLRKRCWLASQHLFLKNYITGAIVGVGSTRRFSAVKWGVANRIVWAWILTIPSSTLIAALSFYVISLVRQLMTGLLQFLPKSQKLQKSRLARTLLIERGLRKACAGSSPRNF